MDRSKKTNNNTTNIGKLYTSAHRNTANSRRQHADNTIVHDLEDVAPPGVVPTISHHISLVNGGPRADAIKQNGHVVANGKPSFRNMLDDADNHPVDSYM